MDTKSQSSFISNPKILHILKTAFDVSDKSFVQNILLEKIETIYNEGLPIYLFQDEIHNIEESPSQLSPFILLESSELCKLLRLSKFDRDTKIRRKGGLRFMENAIIPYHIVWSKRHILIAQKIPIIWTRSLRSLRKTIDPPLRVIRCMILCQKNLLQDMSTWRHYVAMERLRWTAFQPPCPKRSNSIWIM